jgi:hypothetical protein
LTSTLERLKHVREAATALPSNSLEGSIWLE